MGNLRLVSFLGIVSSMVFVLFVSGASAVPTPFSLTFLGAHVSDPTTPFGLRHEGRFTASAPFCPSGRAYDSRQIDDAGYLTVWRLHECDDASGTFTAFMPLVRNEHDGTGTWLIVEGTGRYAELRGQGTYVGTRLSGDPDDFATVTYRTQWQGVVDFDADPPVLESLSANARKLPTQLRAYTLRIAVKASDASTPITFWTDVRAGGPPLAYKIISTTSGRAAFTVRIRPPRTAKSISIRLTTEDVLGNGTSAMRSVRLR